jgi:hypothetical protein
LEEDILIEKGKREKERKIKNRKWKEELRKSIRDKKFNF